MSNARAIADKIARQRWNSTVQIHKMTGGDINQVFKISVSEGFFVLKLNIAEKYPGMFRAEADGLNSLASSQTFKIPRVIATGQVEDMSYLLLEYIVPGTEKGNYWQTFGTLLANMHCKTDQAFGYHIDNYIGSLPQQNNKYDRCAEFYIQQRLVPQFELATGQGYSFSKLDRFLSQLDKIIPDQQPALLHGDLWSGNYLTAQNNQPVLIDPAVAYGPREMDLAMMDLFGGFPKEVFHAYNESFPMEPGYAERRPLWQLYYLLVHLNLFGRGYLGRVRAIVDRYS